MKTDTRKKFTEFQLSLQKAYKTMDLSNSFEISVPFERRILDRVQESNDLLKKITVMGVTDTEGEALSIGTSGLYAKRTDTKKGARKPKLLSGPSGTRWKVAPTEFDVAIDYATLDAWARFKDFRQRYMKHVFEIMAGNRLLVGWYGEKAEETTDSIANPNGEDINYGWFARLKKEKPEHFLGSEEGEVIKLGAGGDYTNLDTLVFDLYGLIPVANRSGNEVVLLGSELLTYDANKNLALNSDDPRRKKEVTTMTNRYASLQVVTAAHLPPRAVLVTDPKNLHLYVQEGASRRHQREEPDYNRITDYMSTNDAYTIGNLDAIAGLNSKAIKFVDEE